MDRAMLERHLAQADGISPKARIISLAYGNSSII
jgi:hypothetical protein